MTEPPLRLNLPPVRSVLYITSDFVIRTSQPVPGRWRRFWYWVLLGWRWAEMP